MILMLFVNCFIETCLVMVLYLVRMKKTCFRSKKMLVLEA
jgi:hypothetical protein